MLSINILAQEFSISTRTLRHYANIGLIDCSVNNKAGRRSFDQKAKEDLEVIMILKQLGFNLNEIGVLLGKNLKDSVDFKVASPLPLRSELISILNKQQSLIKKVKDYVNEH
jgi:DNA-binding transcriptional MerR regulator